MIKLTIKKLTKENFSHFGDVIETKNSNYFMINNGSTKRYHKLSQVDLSDNDDKTIISIFRASKLSFPLQIKMLEKHPKGSQAFIPLKQNPFLIIVAPKNNQPDPNLIEAFITDGTQGVNYFKNTWHHPIITIENEDDFLVIDRDGEGKNCDEYFFSENIQILLNH